jgi:hypothetical protein
MNFENDIQRCIKALNAGGIVLYQQIPFGVLAAMQQMQMLFQIYALKKEKAENKEYDCFYLPITKQIKSTKNHQRKYNTY